MTTTKTSTDKIAYIEYPDGHALITCADAESLSEVLSTWALQPYERIKAVVTLGDEIAVVHASAHRFIGYHAVGVTVYRGAAEDEVLHTTDLDRFVHYGKRGDLAPTFKRAISHSLFQARTKIDPFHGLV